jgi:hypothetical protein
MVVSSKDLIESDTWLSNNDKQITGNMEALCNYRILHRCMNIRCQVLGRN